MPEDLRYPIGEFSPQAFSESLLADWLGDIRFLPNRLEAAITNLDEAQLHTAYRPGGWTVQQVVHHVADSHMNAYMRFKFGALDSGTTIKPYDEVVWAQTADVQTVPINVSITLLFALHQRLVSFLESLPQEDWLRKSVFHPEQKKNISLWDLLGMYAWHGRHHTAHITSLRERMGW